MYISLPKVKSYDGIHFFFEDETKLKILSEITSIFNRRTKPKK